MSFDSRLVEYDLLRRFSAAIDAGTPAATSPGRQGQSPVHAVALQFPRAARRTSGDSWTASGKEMSPGSSRSVALDGKLGVPPALAMVYDNPGVAFGNRGGRERPASRNGETACHFSQTSISKTSSIVARIRAARSGRRFSGSSACAHILYLGRDGAAETLATATQTRRAGPTHTDAVERWGQGRSSLEYQSYIEDHGSAEAGHPGSDDPMPMVPPVASFGTQGETPGQRLQFWEAVERTEASPRGDRIRLVPARNRPWWERARSQADSAPRAIQAYLAAPRTEPFALVLSTDDAFAVCKWASGIGPDAPLDISPGKGGRTQTRIIAELPHELDATQRLEIVKRFTDVLARKQFPFWAVIHAPDHNNDARNYHVHIVYYDRPCRRMPHPDTGVAVWDFEIETEVVYACGKRHRTRPFRQNKDRATNGQDWIPTLRREWETVSNQMLAQAGQTKRYNLGRYADIGIAQTPTPHIPARQFNKERKGGWTEPGAALARRQWDTRSDRIVRELVEQTARRNDFLASRGMLAERLTIGQPDAVARRKAIGTAIGRVLEASHDLALLQLMQEMARCVRDRLASRPRLLLAARRGAPGSRVADHTPSAQAERSDDTKSDGVLPRMSGREDLARFVAQVEFAGAGLEQAYAERIGAAERTLQRIQAALRAWIDEPGRSLSVSLDAAAAPAMATVERQPAAMPSRDQAAIERDPAIDAAFRALVEADEDPAVAALRTRVAQAGRHAVAATAAPTASAIDALSFEPATDDASRPTGQITIHPIRPVNDDRPSRMEGDAAAVVPPIPETVREFASRLARSALSGVVPDRHLHTVGSEQDRATGKPVSQAEGSGTTGRQDGRAQAASRDGVGSGRDGSAVARSGDRSSSADGAGAVRPREIAPAVRPSSATPLKPIRPPVDPWADRVAGSGRSNGAPRPGPGLRPAVTAPAPSSDRVTPSSSPAAEIRAVSPTAMSQSPPEAPAKPVRPAGLPAAVEVQPAREPVSSPTSTSTPGAGPATPVSTKRYVSIQRDGARAVVSPDAVVPSEAGSDPGDTQTTPVPPPLPEPARTISGDHEGERGREPALAPIVWGFVDGEPVDSPPDRVFDFRDVSWPQPARPASGSEGDEAHRKQPSQRNWPPPSPPAFKNRRGTGGIGD